MDISTVIEGLQKTLNVVERLAPVAKMIGGSTVDNISSIIGASVSIASNALERVQEGRLVANATEEAELRGIIRELQAQNDTLATAIANS